MEQIPEVARARTGQVLTVTAPAPGVGWPSAVTKFAPGVSIRSRAVRFTDEGAVTPRSGVAGRNSPGRCRGGAEGYPGGPSR
jgi:hypothetical protein